MEIVGDSMKNRRMGKISHRRLSLVLILVLVLGFTSYATEGTDEIQNRIDEQQEEIDKTQNSINEVEEKKQKLQDAKSKMEEYLRDLNHQYATIEEQIEDLSQQISDKEKEIEQTLADLEEARRIEEKQYADMKTRIQYMYEHQQGSLFSVLLEGNSIADALNKASYAASITEYDERMMENYIAQKEAIAEKEAKLEGEKEALDELHASVTRKRDEVSALAKNTSGKINEHVNAISAAQADLEGKNDTLESQKKVLKELIAEKKRIEAEIEAAKQAEIEGSLGEGVTGVRTTEQEYVQYGAYNASEEEVRALAVLIHCEAANQGDAGRLAVGAVVMNRIRDPRFSQGDIMSVIRARGQFSPVTSGRFDLILTQGLDTVSQSCYDAARRAIAGESNVGNRVFFRTYTNAPYLSGLVIGAHIFSYTWNFAA